MWWAQATIEWATAMLALPGPRVPRRRWSCADRSVPRLRAAALAHSIRVARSHFDPLRVRSDVHLPADSLLPGYSPVQEARWPAEGKRDMSAPLSAMMTSAERLSTPGIVRSSSTSVEKG